MSTLSISALAAESLPPAPNRGAPPAPAFPQGCVKLEDEIKFAGSNVFFSDLGHLTAGNLAVGPLTSVDPKAAEVIRTDDIKGLRDDEQTLVKGEVTLESATPLNPPTSVKFENEPINPRTSISIQIRRTEGEDANISGVIKLKPAEIALIKLKHMDLKTLDAPYAVCGVGMQLYLSHGKKKIERGTLILYIHHGSDKTIAIEALNTDRGKKPTSPVNTQLVSEPRSTDLDRAGRAF